MGTGLSIPPAADVTLARAADDYLATLSGAEQASTRRQYGRILRRLVLEFGADAAPADLDPDRFAGWFASQWGQRPRRHGTSRWMPSGPPWRTGSVRAGSATTSPGCSSAASRARTTPAP